MIKGLSFNFLFQVSIVSIKLAMADNHHPVPLFMPKKLDFDDETTSSSSSDKELSPKKLNFGPTFTPPHRPPPLGRPLPKLHLREESSQDLTNPRKRRSACSRSVNSTTRVVTSPVTAPRARPHPRLLFSPEENERRRTSAPLMAMSGTPLAGGRHRMRCGRLEENKSIRKSRIIRGNINPFTPSSLKISANAKKAREEAKRQCLRGVSMVGEEDNEEIQKSIIAFMKEHNEEQQRSNNSGWSSNESSSLSPLVRSPEILPDSPLNPAKRLKVQDIHIARYKEEFIELQDIGTGMFGSVKIARHRLDGMVYAIKVTRSEVVGNTLERSVMNEVFAHAALMKHKHVVRYYNSWVEKGHIYIQNEYCEGGTLANQIKVRREEGKPFPESELKRIITHLARGLQYIHSKNLVHLDVKPENIFIALDHVTVNSDNEDDTPESSSSSSTTSSSDESPETPRQKSPATERAGTITPPDSFVKPSTDSPAGTPKSKKLVNDSTDSGNASDGSKPLTDHDKVSYKIGDLGHVAQIKGDYIPEEGDCRYFAPELLSHEVDFEKLPKADIFSLGLTLFECATLINLPKNSEDDPVYQKIRSGQVPHIPGYSKEFNQLVKLMISPDVMSRPSARRILSHPFVRKLSKKKRSNYEMQKELKAARQRLKELESQLAAKALKKAAKKAKVVSTAAQEASQCSDL